MLLSWLRNVAKPIRSSRRERRSEGLDGRFRRPRLEALEDRTLPSTFHWNVDGGGAWDNPGNWFNDTSGNVNGFPSVIDDVANFFNTTTNANPNRAVTLAANESITVGAVNFDGSDNYTIAGVGTGAKLVFSVSTGSAVLSTAATAAGTDVLAVQVTANSPLTGIVSGGTLQLTNTSPANTIGSGSTFTVNTGGTLRASAAGQGSLVTGNLVDVGALGSAALALNGGTLALDPTASTAATGLASKYITGSSVTDLLDYAGAAAIAASPAFQTGPTNPAAKDANTFSFNTSTPTTGVAFFSGGPTTNFGSRWTGMINVTAPGPTRFSTQSDDGTRLFIDGVLVINNDAGHGPTTLSATVNLNAGLHDLRLDYGQGTGGDVAQVSYGPVGGTLQPIPFSVLYTPDPLALTNNVSVTGNSTIQLNGGAFTTVGLGNLTTSDASNLTVSGLAGRSLRFSGATLGTAGGTVTLNTAPDVFLGRVTSVSGTTVVKASSGQLVLDNTSSASPNSLSTTTLDVQGGKLVAIGSGTTGATNPLSTAAVTLEGGALALDTTFFTTASPATAFTFDNAVNVNQSGTIEDRVGGLSLVLGSAANGITIAGGQTLTVNTWAGSATVNDAGGGITAVPGAALQLAGNIGGGGSLVKSSTPLPTTVASVQGSLTLSGSNTFQGSLTANAGTLTLTGSNTYAGDTTVNAGATLTLSGGGTIAGSSSYTINVGGALTADSSGTLNNNRLGDTAPITLNGGTLSLVGNSGTATTETIGPVTLLSGSSVINSTANTGMTVTSTGSLTRTAGSGATVNFTGVNGGTSKVLFNTALPLTNNIVPWATVGGTDFATYGGNGVVAFANYVTLLAAAGPNDNVKLSASEPLTGNKTINSLVLVNNTTVAEGGFTLTLGSGGLLNTGAPGTISGGTLNFGPAEGVVSTNTGATTITSAVAGTGGVTLNGVTVGSTATLNLAAVNAYSGVTTLNNGTINIGNNAAFGTSTVAAGPGSAAVLQAGSSTSLSNPLALTNSTLTLGSPVPFALTGTATLTGNNTLVVNNTGGTTLAGSFAGTGNLTLTGAQTLFLPSGSSGYSGTITLNGPTLVVGDNNSLGAGTLVLTSGTLQASTPVALANAAVTLNGVLTTTGSNALTLGGAVTLADNSALNVNNATTIAGNVGESGGARVLGVAGTGTLTLAGTNTYSGGTTLNSGSLGALGTLVIGSAGAVGSGPLTLATGTLQTSVAGGVTLSNLVSLAAGVVTFGGTNPITFSNASATGNVLAAGTTTLIANNTTTFNEVLSGSGSLTVLGTGQLVLQSANTYAGTTTIGPGAAPVGGGMLVLSGNGALSPAATSVLVNTGGTLTLDNTAANSSTRLPAGLTLTLAGGTFNFNGTGGAASTQTLGQINLAGGHSTVSVNPGSGGTAAVTLAGATGLAHSAGATVNFTGGGQVILTNPPGTSGGILPYATVNGTDFATLSGSQLSAFTGYSTTLAAGQNVKLTGPGNFNVTSNLTINSLVLSGDATVSISTGVTLTIATGAILTTGTTNGATITGGTLQLGAEGVVLANAGSGLTVSSTLAGNSGLTVGGGGTLILSSADTYTGTTTLNAGTLSLGNVSALSPGTLVLTGGTLLTTVTGGVTLANAVTLTKGAVTFGGTQPLTFTGTATLAGINTLTTTNTAATTFAGVVQGTASLALAKAGPGTLVLAGANTYAGLTLVNVGVVNIQNSSALGGATGLAVVAPGATIQLQGNGLNVATPVTLQGLGAGNNGALENVFGSNTWAGAVNLVVPNPTMAVGVGVDLGALTLSGVVSGPADLAEVGNGTLVLSAGNTYFGTTTAASGVLQVTNATALGNVTGGTVVSAGATLQLNAAVTFPGEQLTLNGTGFAPFNLAGALRSSATSTWTGNITLNTGATIGVDSGSTLTVSGNIGGTDLTKVGPGTLALTGNNSYTGVTTVNNGGTAASSTLILQGFGTALASSGFVVNAGATLTVDNNVAGLISNRIGDTATLTLNGGTFNFLGNNVGGVITTETIGQIIFGRGNSTIVSQSGTGLGAVSRLTAAGLTRSAGATATFALGSGTNPFGSLYNQLLLTTPPALVNGILPWAVINSGSDFVTYGASGVAAFANYVNSLAAAGPTDNVKISANEALAGNKTVNSLIVNGSLTVPLGNFTLTLASGGLSTVGGTTNTTITGGTVSFGTNEGLISANAATTTIQSVIAGSGGLTLFGSNTLVLANPNSYTGTTTLDAGTVSLGSANAFGGAGNPLVLTGGTLQATGGLTFPTNYTLNNSVVSFGANVQVTFTGTGTLSGFNTINITSTGGTTFSGPVTGAGSLTISGAGTQAVFFPNANPSYAGTVNINNAVVGVGNNSSLGTGLLTLTSGSLLATSPVTLANSALAIGGGFTFTGTNPVTYNNTVNLTANSTLTVNNTTTFNGSVVDVGPARTLTFGVGGTATGFGTLALTGANTYSGGTTLNAPTPANTNAGGATGVLSVGSSTALGLGTVTLTGGVLQAGTPVTMANALSIGAGPVFFAGSAMTFTNTVTLTAATTLGFNNSTTFAGAMTSTNTALTLTGLPAATAAGFLFPTGQLNLTNANDSLGTGTLTISGATLALSGAGKITAAGTLTVNVGGTLLYDDSAATAATVTRLPTGQAVTLNGGTYSFVGSNVAGVSSAETIGAVSLSSGNSTIRSAKGTGGSASLTATSLARSAGATVDFDFVNADPGITNSVVFTTAPTLTGTLQPVLPYGVVTGPGGVDFASYSGGIVRASYDTSADINSAAAGSTFKLTSATTTTSLTAAKSLNAVLISGNNLTLGGAAGVALTLTGASILTAGGSNTISVPTVALGAVEGILSADASATLTIATTNSTTITGTAGLTLSGLGTTAAGAPRAGTLVLSNGNSYSGTTTLDGATVTLGTNTAIPNVALTLSSGTLQSSLPVTLTGAVTFNSAGSSVTIAGSNPIIFAGATMALGAAASNTTLTTSDTAGTFITGQITGAGVLTKAGAGTLFLPGTGTASSYTGDTLIAQGVVNLQVVASLGASANVIVGPTNAAIQLQAIPAGLSFARPLTLLGGTGVNNNGALENLTGTNTWSAAITLAGNSTVGVDVAQLTISGAISGAADLTKAGGGTLVLSAANTYTGTTNVNVGILQISNATALGLITGGTAVTSGATLQLNSANTTFVGEQLTLAGTGLGLNNSGLLTDMGAVTSLAVATWTGNVILSAAASIATPANLTVTGIVSGGNAASLTKVGSGQLILQTANTYSGATTVNVGTLSLGGSGSAQSSLSFTVNVGATLQLDNTTTNVVDRLNDAVGITLGGGTFTFLGSNTFGTPSTETVGTITLSRGNSTILSQTGTGIGSTAQLTSAGLVRLPGATVNFAAGGAAGAQFDLSSDGNQVFFRAPMSAANGTALVGSGGGIWPWATVTSLAGAALDFATYGADGVAPFANYKNSIATAGPTDTVRILANEALTTTKTINALVIVSSAIVAEGGFGLTLASGGLLTTAGGTATITGGTLDFGQAEGVVIANTNATFNSVLTGSAPAAGVGLTLAAGSGSTIQFPTANTYSGNTVFDGPGSLNVTNTSALSTGLLTLTAGTLGNNDGTNQFAIGNALVLNNSVVSFGTGSRITLAGPMTLTGSNYVTTANTTYVAGTVGGTGSLTVSSGGNPLVMQGANTYSGGTNLNSGGVLVVTNNSALGTGPANLSLGTIESNLATTSPGTNPGVASVTLANPITLINAALTINGPLGTNAGGDLNFSGTTTLTGANTVTVTNPGTVGANGATILTGLGSGTTFSGKITGTGQLVKAGANALLLNNSTSDFSGGVTITAGAVTVGANSTGTPLTAGPLGTGVVSLNAGTLQDDGTARPIGNLVYLVATGSTVNTNAGLTFNGVTEQSGTTVFTLTKTGAGTLSFQNAATYTGATTVSLGTLLLNAGGTALASAGFTVAVGATLQLDNTANVNPNRIGDAATLGLGGGTFSFVGNTARNSSETLGAITLSGGNSTISSASGTGGGTALITAASLARTANVGATVNFAGVNANLGTASNQIRIGGTLPTVTTVTNGTILPYATVTGTTAGSLDFATSSTGTPGGIAAFTGYVNGPIANSTSVNDVVKVTASEALAASKIIAGLLISGTNITISGTVQLVLTAGTNTLGSVLATGGSNTISAPILAGTTATGTNELIVATNSGSTTTLSGLLANNGSNTTGLNISGVTASNPGTLVLSATNTFTGQTFLNGALTIANGTANANVLGNTTAALVITGGTIQDIAGTAQTVANPVTLTGPVTIVANNTTAPGFSFSGVISGAGSPTKLGGGVLTFSGSGANTFTGAFIENAGTYQANKSANTASLATGPLVINNGATVSVLATGQLNSVNVVINPGGVLNVNANTSTIGNLTLTGGATSAVQGTGTLTLAGNVTVLGSATTATIAVSNLNLNNAIRTFNIGSGATPGLTISGVINSSTAASGGMTKVGAGILQFSGSGANTYSSTTSVNEGSLQLNKTAASFAGPVIIGDFGGGAGADQVQVLNTTNQLNTQAVTIQGSGQLNFTVTGGVSTTGALTLNGGSVVGTGTSTLTLGGNLTATPSGQGASVAGNVNVVLNASRSVNVADAVGLLGLTISSVISGANQGVTKLGAGTLVYAGASANTYSGITTVNEGTLLLAKTAAVNGFNGPLIIGDGIGGNDEDVVRLLTSNNQIPATQTVEVNAIGSVYSSGLLDLNGLNDTIAALAMNGGDVTTGAGTLTLNGNVIGNAFPTPATIAGKLALGPATRTFDISAGGGANDMIISAVISGTGGLTKSNLGTLLLTGANGTFTAPVTVSAGTLLVDGPLGSAVGVTGSTLGGTGSTGAVTVGTGGVVNPGDPVSGKGILTTGAADFSSGGNLALQVAGYTTPGTSYDRLNLGAAALSLGGTSTLTLDLAGLTTPGTAAGVLQYGSVTGAFSNALTPTLVNNPSNFTALLSNPNATSLDIIFTAPSTTTISSSAPTSVFSQSVTFTVTVAPIAPVTGVPQGTVVFSIDGNLQPAVTLSGGQASISTTTLVVGPHSVTAAFTPSDTNFAASTSAAFSQTVNQAPTSTALVSSAAPAVFGQTVTFTATVTASPPATAIPTGPATVTFTVDGAAQTPVPLNAGGVATLDSAFTSLGMHTVTAAYNGDASYLSSSSSTLGQVVVQAGSTVVVSSSASPSVFGQSVTLTATVAAATPGSGTPTGVVTFTVDGAPQTPVVLSGGHATLVTSALGVGPHTVTAAFGGEPNFAMSTSANFVQTVNKADTNTAIGSSAAPSVFGQDVTLTATVSAASPGAGLPTGVVSFTVDGTSAGSATLSGGQASVVVTGLGVGPHDVVTSYGGDGNFNGGAGSTTQTVNKADTTAALSSSLNPSVFGQSVTFTATAAAVLPGASMLTGTVTFSVDGIVQTPDAPVSGGQATFTTSALAIGGRTITAHYNGDGNFNGSNSAAFSQTINTAPTTTALASSVPIAVFGQSIDFTATVTAPGGGTPTGFVTFTVDTVTTGPMPLSGGQATLSRTLSVGPHTLSAAYLGDSNFNASGSSNFSQSVVKAGTNLDLMTSAQTIVFGDTVTFTAAVTAVPPGSGTPAGSVVFSVDGSDQATVTLNGSAQATYSTNTLSLGLHAISARYTGDGNFANSPQGNLLQNVSSTTSTTMLASSAPTSVFGQSVTFTATLTLSSGDPSTVQGVISFSVDGTRVASVAPVGGVATFATSTLSVGPHTVKAVYSGDINVPGSSSADFMQTVNTDDTTTVVAASGSPSVFGQSVTFTAAIAAKGTGSGTPTGTVTFTIDSGTPVPVALSGGQATLSTATLAVGPHSVTVSYGGDTNFNGSTSAALPQTVNQADTTTTVASSGTPSVFGQSVTFTATVTPTAPGAGTRTGSVMFTIDSGTPVSVALSGGQATLSTATLAVGPHTITATYSGDGNFNGSTSTTFAQAVNQAATTTTVSSAPAPSAFGQAVTFTATVTAVSPGAGTPTNLVSFIVDGVTLGVTSLSGGVATFTTSALLAAPHSVQASYGGDASFTGSTSAARPITVNKAGTNTAVASSSSTSVFGQTVTFTATVTAVGPGAGVPTGTVTFLDGTNTLGTGTLDPTGLATFSTSGLSVAGHAITATYGGDSNFSTSSTALTQAVNQDTTSTAVTTSVNVSVFGQSVTFTATVTANPPGSGVPGGVVTFLDGTSTLGTGTLDASGTTTFTTSTLAAGSHTITASYGGSGNFMTSSAALTQAVDRDLTTTTVTTSGTPTVFGQAVTFMATVTANAPGAGLPTGTVVFLDGAAAVGTGSLDAAGKATFTTAALRVTGHTIMAVYAGDGSFQASSASVAQTVNKDGTGTALASSSAPSVSGQPVTFTATVTANGPGSGTPTGTVTFTEGAATLGTGSLDAAGQATFTTSALAVGPHTVTATYGGDGSFLGSAGSLAQTVNKEGTATGLESSAAPSVSGQSVTFTATVTANGPGAGVPTGAVTFTEGAATLGTGALDGSGRATFTTSSLAVGPHTVTATYGGDGSFLTSAGTFSQTVNKDATTTALALAPNPSAFEQSVTFTVTLTANGPGTGTPTGTVTFTEGAATLGSGTLDGSGHATFTTSALAVGSHTITASFGGDGNFLISSTALAQVVNKDGTSTALITSGTPSLAGHAVTFTATVTAAPPGAGLPSGTVVFLDNGTAVGTGALNASGRASLTTAALTVGSHTITAAYAGDGNFQASSLSLTQDVNKDGTGTALASSAAPSVSGQSVTFTATVSANVPGAVSPTGTVTFTDGATTLGTGTLDGTGHAALTTSALTVGGHTITASYGGDGNFQASSTSVTQTVNEDGTTTALVSSAAPSVSGQSVTFTATVTANGPGSGTPTGTVTFTEGAATLGTGSLDATGKATFTTPSLAVGPHTVTATYGGDGNFLTSAGTFGQTVNKDATTTALASSATPSVFGQTVTFTATVTANGPGSGTPTGTLTFSEGAATLGSRLLDASGQATFTTSGLAVGSHTITASYAGNANFLTGGTTLTQAVNKDATTAALASSVTPSVAGQSVTFTVTVTSNAPGAGLPTGTVSFLDGSTSLGAGTLNAAGQTSLTTSALAVGSHPISITYGGDGNFLAAGASLVQVVNKDATTTALASSSDPSVWGQSVTFTATVTANGPGSGVPAGNVVFLDGSAPLGVAALDASGRATLTTSALAVGGHTITAGYGGDGSFQPGTSAALNQVVNQDGTTTALVSSVNPTVFGQAVTLTATVTPNAPGAGTLTGSVTFREGASVLGTGALDATGLATFSTSGLAVGSHTVTATYGGDGNFQASSTSLAQVVNKGATAVALGSSVAPSAFGQSVTFAATLTASAPAAGKPSGAVTFLDGSATLAVVPLDGSGHASFTTAALAVGSHTITASYGGDGSFTTGSTTLAQPVNKDATTVALTSSASPTVPGQPVQFMAIVTAAAPGAGSPTGVVTFQDGTNVLGTAAVDAAGRAAITTSALPEGSHMITANYGGDGSFLPNASTVTQDVKLTSTVTLTSAGSSQVGQSVTFTARVTGSSGGGPAPSGNLIFSVDGVAQTQTALDSSGKASFTPASLTVGDHRITADYSGDANFLSGSGLLVQTVTKAASTTVLTVSVTSSGFGEPGQPVTFTATVQSSVAGVTPTGNMTFVVDGGAPVTLFIGSGSVSFATTDLTVGHHSVTAAYSGDGNLLSSVSPALPVTVGSPQERFVNQAYLDLLGRPAEAGGMGYWVSVLGAGISRPQVVLAIEASQEYETRVIKALYTTVLGREADPVGLGYFVGLLATGGTVEQVKALMAGSDEFFLNRALGSTDSFLNALYVLDLNRPLDPAGRQFFSQALAFGATRVQVADLLFSAQEYQADVTQSFYREFLQRNADGGGLDFFVKALQLGARDEQLIALIAGSDEYFSKL